MHAYVIVDPRRAQIRTGETIVQCTLSADRSYTDSTVHKYSVPNKKVFKLLKCFWIFLQKFFKLLKSDVVEISFKAADASKISCKSCPANLFADFVNQFAILHQVQEARIGAGIHTH